MIKPMKCPNCGAHDGATFTARASVVVRLNSIGDIEECIREPRIREDVACICDRCGYGAWVGDFQMEEDYD